MFFNFIWLWYIRCFISTILNACFPFFLCSLSFIKQDKGSLIYINNIKVIIIIISSGLSQQTNDRINNNKKMMSQQRSLHTLLYTVLTGKIQFYFLFYHFFLALYSSRCAACLHRCCCLDKIYVFCFVNDLARAHVMPVEMTAMIWVRFVRDVFLWRLEKKKCVTIF